MTEMTFDQLPLSEEVMKAVAAMGFTQPSPIQAEAIPKLLQGHDLIGQAQTGTGKTVAFGIPVVEKVDTRLNHVQGIILCPTRELALQVSEELRKISAFKPGLRTAAIYGGESIDRQIRQLRAGVHIVIGTPGRVIDHLERNTLVLDRVHTIILDEADEMLDMGFREDIELILSRLPEERQTVFFSATMSKDILQLTKRYQKNPEIIKIARNELTTDTIEQFYYQVKSKHKAEVFARLVEFFDLKLMLVFCNTKKMVDELCVELQSKGFAVEGLHGDMRQTQRNTVMSKFRNGSIKVLIATDVAARGIDVENVDAVFNYDLPMDDEYYVHRIGRTGRAGRQGKSLTFVSPKDMGRLKDIMRYTKANIAQAAIPTLEQIIEKRRVRFVENIAALLTDEPAPIYYEIAQDLMAAEPNIARLVAALSRTQLGSLSQDTTDEVIADNNRSDRYERGSERPSGGERSGNRYERGSDSRRPYERRDNNGSSSAGGYERRNDNNGSSNYERPRFERPERSSEGFSKGPRQSDPDMVRLFINLGRSSGVSPADIVGAIAGETKIPGKRIGQIEIFDKFSFVEVPQEVSQQVISVMDNNQIKGKRVNIEVAR